MAAPLEPESDSKSASIKRLQDSGILFVWAAKIGFYVLLYFAGLLAVSIFANTLRTFWMLCFALSLFAPCGHFAAWLTSPIARCATDSQVRSCIGHTGSSPSHRERQRYSRLAVINGIWCSSCLWPGSGFQLSSFPCYGSSLSGPSVAQLGRFGNCRRPEYLDFLNVR